MESQQLMPLRIADEDAALRFILEGTATVTGERFFKALVQKLAEALNTRYAWVTEYIEEARKLRAIAFWAAGQWVNDLVMEIDGSPCEAVIKSKSLIHFPDNIVELFPKDSYLKEMQAVSYMGVPLLDNSSRILGHLAVMDDLPMPREPRAEAIFNIFATRASAEVQRIRAEMEVRQREEKYRRIIETTGEGFMLMNQEFIITDVNEAFCKMSGYRRGQILGRTPLDFVTEEQRQFLFLNREELLDETHRQFETTLVARDGRRIPVLFYGDLLKDDHGAAIGKMGFVIDLTHQKRALALAGEVQNSLLPQKSPQINGFDIAGKTVSCDEIGGDYFDFLVEHRCSDGHFSVVVGDVTGHGVDAALLMTTARAILRMRAAQCGAISQIITEMNRYWSQDVLDTGRFMTLFYVSIDPVNRHLRWVRAGHTPALIYDPQSDRFVDLDGEGLALGLDARYVYKENLTPELASGQIIAIGTDGIWEARDRRNHYYGQQRFREMIRSHAAQDANAIIKAVFDDLRQFTLGLRQEDDITLVVIKVKEPAQRIVDWQI